MITYRKCPKCGYERREGDVTNAEVCPNCGLVFSKWLRHQFARPSAPHGTAGTSRVRGDGSTWPGALWRQLRTRVSFVDPQMPRSRLYAYAAIYVLFFVWGWSFILTDYRTDAIGQSFMHRVDLVFHEAGHVVFRPFGQFITILGGSLGQLLMPLAVLAALLFRNRDPFGASIGLWWLAQSLMDLAPYIGDARAMRLVLLGGGTGRDRPGMHDWHNILSSLGWLEADHTLAAMTDALGVILMLTAFVWGASILYGQFGRLRR